MIKTYTKYIVTTFIKSLLYVFLSMTSLGFLINLLTELDFFKNIEVDSYFPIYLSLLNTPTITFEMFTFIFLIATQFFFIKLFNNSEIKTFKYSGLKNEKILKILATTTFLIGLFIIAIFYNFSSNLKNFYLLQKSNYTQDDKYLAVITKNGLWIKDYVNNNNLIINANKIEKNFLIDTFITEFDSQFNILKNIKSKSINIENLIWELNEVEIFQNNTKEKLSTMTLNSNFNYQKIKSLFSNLSSLSFFELYELKNNYKTLNYSTTEVDIQIHKIISSPFYFVIVTILSSLIMFNSKKFSGMFAKIAIGLFLSVIIYYINNFFHVLGNSEKIHFLISIWAPIIILSFINIIMLRNINEK